jgi:hypothetical protein
MACHRENEEWGVEGWGKPIGGEGGGGKADGGSRERKEKGSSAGRGGWLGAVE